MIQAGAAREAVRELERGVASIGLPDDQLAAVAVHLRKIDEEANRNFPEPEKVVEPLKKITEIATAAGALAGLAGPIENLITWLGPLGQPIAKLLSGF